MSMAGLIAQPAVAAGPSTVIIGAVLPNPSQGPEWVVIENRADGQKARPFRMFLPLMMHPIGGDAPTAQVGLPPLLTIADIAGWQLGTAGAWYTLPPDLPPMPAGTKVIVYFDGLGAAANDYDFSDGVAELHSPAGMTDVFPDTTGKVMLYAGDVATPDNLRAQYAWAVVSDE
jgi:hypothetical protein